MGEEKRKKLKKKCLLFSWTIALYLFLFIIFYRVIASRSLQPGAYLIYIGSVFLLFEMAYDSLARWWRAFSGPQP